MIYLFACLTGVAGALAGWAVAMLGASSAGIGPETIGRLAATAIGPFGAAIGFFAAVASTLYLRGGVRSFREIAIRSAAVAAMLGISVAGGAGLRSATLSHLGLTTAAPAVEFEIRLPQLTAAAAIGPDAQVELLTDQNQTIARLDERLAATDDGRAVLKGSVPLRFRTIDRVVMLSLPGQGQRLFKLRLPAEPSRSAEFSPWHLADRVIAPTAPNTGASNAPNDAFAIRYRVL